MAGVWISSDWHLGPLSPPSHGALALAFLARARQAGVEVILNGDAFDELFAGGAAARASHPGVAAAIEALEREGRLRRTAGNHDPGAGPARLELEWPRSGRVLVTHGHSLDPINSSPIGRLGDAVARRFGRSWLVRAAAALAAAAARTLAGERMVAAFRARCLRAVEEGGFDLGVFGHVHRAHAIGGDRYVNAGSLRDGALEWAVLDDGEARIERLRSD